MAGTYIFVYKSAKVRSAQLGRDEDMNKRDIWGSGNVHFHAYVDEVSLNEFWHGRLGDMIGREGMTLLATHNLSFRHPSTITATRCVNALCKTSKLGGKRVEVVVVR